MVDFSHCSTGQAAVGVGVDQTNPAHPLCRLLLPAASQQESRTGRKRHAQPQVDAVDEYTGADDVLLLCVRMWCVGVRRYMDEERQKTRASNSVQSTLWETAQKGPSFEEFLRLRTAATLSTREGMDYGSAGFATGLCSVPVDLTSHKGR